MRLQVFLALGVSLLLAALARSDTRQWCDQLGANSGQDKLLTCDAGGEATFTDPIVSQSDPSLLQATCHGGIGLEVTGTGHNTSDLVIAATDISAYRSVGLTFTGDGTWIGQLAFEGSNDGTHWAPTPLTDNVLNSSNGLFGSYQLFAGLTQVDVKGALTWKQFRVRINAHTSGTTDIAARAEFHAFPITPQTVIVDSNWAPVNVTGTVTPAAPNGTILATAVSVGTTATALPTTALSNRESILIVNNCSATEYIGGSGVTTSSGIPLAAGDHLSKDAGPSVAFFAIVATGTCDTRVVEAAQ